MSATLKRWLPILEWLPNYDRTRLRPDFLAGLTVMALLVPEGMAYAELAGMPPETAFYAAPIGLVLYAVFGSSKHLVVAVSSAIAVMSASIVGSIALPNSAEFFALTAALAVMVGLVSILAGLLKLGRIAQFFSESVLVGFVSGLAFVIAIKQLPKLFGLEPAHGNFWERLIDLFRHLPEMSWPTLAVGATSILLMVILERRFHRVPAALVAMIYGILVTQLIGAQWAVHVVGDIPAGLVPPQLPDVAFADLLRLLPGAAGMALVMFAEAIGPARTFAGEHGYQIDANQELIALGSSNLGAGLFRGFPIGASLSKSAANDAAGAHSQMSGLIAAGATALVALFLTPLFRNLPEATLAAIVIVAVSGMVKVRDFRWLYKVNKVDYWLAAIALLAVLTFEEVLVGLLVAVIISLLALVRRASQARVSVLGRVPGTIQLANVQQYPGNIEVPGILILRPDEGLFFANAATLRTVIQDMVLKAQRPLRSVLVDLELSNELDASTIHELHELHTDLKTLNVRLMLSRVHPKVQDVMERSELIAVIGKENIFSRGIDAVVAHLQGDEADTADFLELVAGVLQSTRDAVETAMPRASDWERAQLEAVNLQLQASLNTLDNATGEKNDGKQ